MTSRRSASSHAYVDRKFTDHTRLFWPTHGWRGGARGETCEMVECPHHSNVISSSLYFKQMAEDAGAESDPQDNFWNPPRSKSFWKAFRQSKDAYFTDRYFEKENIDQVVVEEVLQANRESRCTPQSIVIFLEAYSHNKLKSSMVKQLINGGVMRCQIEVLRFPENYQIHDRFALFDDNIWHCGATVGGVHGAFHAISGPWKDIEGKMKMLFDKMQADARR